MTPSELLNRRVILRGGVEVGRIVDVILDARAETVLGYDVLCGDGEHRFLAAAAAADNDGQVELDSPFVLLERTELEFYRERGRSVRSGSAR